MVRIVKKPDERRREIILASRSLFLKKGYENTTIQDVMAKLRIAKGTTYHYFKSKEQLLGAVVEDLVDEYISVIEKSLDECQGTALEKIQILIVSGKVAPSSSDTLDALHRSDNRALHARLLAEILIKLAPLYANVISQGCKEGIFHVERPLECAEILIAGIQFVTDVGCYPWRPEDLERRMRAIPSFIEQQLNAPEGSFDFLFTFYSQRD